MSDTEFYALTPLQFRRLMRRHNEERVHREMIGAFTTAAVTNGSFVQPEKKVAALDYMPSHREAPAPDAVDDDEPEEAAEARSSYELKAMRLANQMKAGSGAMLDRLRNGEAL